VLCYIVLSYVVYDLSSRAPLPLLIYSGGGGLQAEYPIWYYYNTSTTYNFLIYALILRDGPPLMVRPIYSHEGIWGLYPHNLDLDFKGFCKMDGLGS
jgi:hypothetical protein